MARRKMKLNSPGEVRKSLAKIANMVINGEISSKEASTFTYMCNAILQSIRADEQEKRINELEEYVNELKNKN